MTSPYRHGIVHDVSRVARRAIRLLAFAAALAAAPVVASAQTLSADFNGDGIHDQVEPGERRVWKVEPSVLEDVHLDAAQ